MFRVNSVALAVASAMVFATTAEAQVTLNGKELTTNAGMGTGVPVMEGDSLKMMNGEYGAARSAISAGTYNLSGPWSTSFRLTFSCAGVGDNPDPGVDEEGLPNDPYTWCPGDGIGFVVTDGLSTQVGSGGGSLGYDDSFPNSVAFGLQTFWNRTVFGSNGALTPPCCETGTFLDSSEDFLQAFDINLSFLGGTLNAKVFLASDNSLLYNDDFATGDMLWASNARVGFVAGSGSATEMSWVSNWELNAPPGVDPFATVPEPSTYVLMCAGLGALGLMARRRGRVSRS